MFYPYYDHTVEAIGTAGYTPSTTNATSSMDDVRHRSSHWWLGTSNSVGFLACSNGLQPACGKLRCPAHRVRIVLKWEAKRSHSLRHLCFISFFTLLFSAFSIHPASFSLLSLNKSQVYRVVLGHPRTHPPSLSLQSSTLQ